MGRFIQVGVERLELDGGDWVDLRTSLRFGDRRAIEERLYGLRSDATGRVVLGTELHMAEANVETMLRSIVAWGGPGFCSKDEHPHDGDCTPRPITAENLDGLDETGERILEEIVRRQRTHTPGFTNARPTPSPQTGGGGADPTPSSPDDGSSSSTSSSAQAGPGTSS